MPRIASAVALSLLLVPAFARGAEPEHRATGNLAIRARAIFHKHCAECHTGSLEPGASKLKLMDREQVVAKKTPVPLAAANGRSQILELVKDGSMPPGNRPGPSAEEIATLEKWVNEKAPAYPVAFDEKYTLTALANDFDDRVARTKVGDPADFTRYVSFAHLIRDGQPVPDLGAAEQALNDALSAAAGQPYKAEPVDPAATLFRVETNRLGWFTREVFEKMEGRKAGGAFRLQPFDLILMEYPDARALAPNDPLAGRLEKLLAPGAQVRPVPYVKGEWLTGALQREKQLTPLAQDLKALAALEKALAGGAVEPDGPVAAPFAGAKPLSVPAATEGRAPIPPLSAWYAGAVTPAKAPFTLKAELVITGKAVTEVKVDEAFQLQVTCGRDANFVLLMVQADGEIRVQPVQGGTRLKANTERLLAPNGASFVISGIGDGGDTATEYFVLLASEEELPLPTILRSKHADKYVWRFLMDPVGKDKFDPNAVVRKVIPIKVTRK